MFDKVKGRIFDHSSNEISTPANTKTKKAKNEGTDIFVPPFFARLLPKIPKEAIIAGNFDPNEESLRKLLAERGA